MFLVLTATAIAVLSFWSAATGSRIAEAAMYLLPYIIIFGMFAMVLVHILKDRHEKSSSQGNGSKGQVSLIEREDDGCGDADV